MTYKVRRFVTAAVLIGLTLLVIFKN
jgi:hypothetical protein